MIVYFMVIVFCNRTKKFYLVLNHKDSIPHLIIMGIFICHYIKLIVVHCEVMIKVIFVMNF